MSEKIKEILAMMSDPKCTGAPYTCGIFPFDGDAAPDRRLFVSLNNYLGLMLCGFAKEMGEADAGMEGKNLLVLQLGPQGRWEWNFKNSEGIKPLGGGRTDIQGCCMAILEKPADDIVLTDEDLEEFRKFGRTIMSSCFIMVGAERVVFSVNLKEGNLYATVPGAILARQLENALREERKPDFDDMPPDVREELLKVLQNMPGDSDKKPGGDGCERKN